MNALYISVLAGAGFGVLGGAVRFAITVVKTLSINRKIAAQGLLMYAAMLILVGAFSGLMLNYGNVISFLAGYAGLDLMDGYYKAFSRKKIKMKASS